MTFKCFSFYPLALLIGLFACLGHGQQVNVIPNKYVLTSTDTDLILQCVNFGLQANPYNVVVFTILEKVVYNSSNSGQLDPAVVVINQTSISYSNILNGVVDVSCRINNTATQIPITVPYVAPVVLVHSPAKFNPNQTFSEQCQYSVSPNVSNVVVNFTLNNTLIGQYVNVPFQSPFFQTSGQLTNLSVMQGNTSYSIFVTPANASAGGLYQCTILVTVPSGSAMVSSNIWNTNGSPALAPSTATVLLTIIVLLSFFNLRT